MNWYISVLKKYATFTGRARRREFWFYCLFNAIVSWSLFSINDIPLNINSQLKAWAVVAGSLYLLATFIPTLAVSIRRLHDTGRTGETILMGLAPITGLIVLIVFFAQDSQQGTNQYGGNTKDTSGTVERSPHQSTTAPAGQVQVQWYVEVLKKYATFDGRAHRREFWLFFVFSLILYIACYVIDILISYGIKQFPPFGLLGGIYIISFSIPNLAITTRRLHDTNRSGILVLLSLIPVVGQLVLLYFLVLNGQPQTNKYGIDPKATPSQRGPIQLLRLFLGKVWTTDI